MQCALDIQLDLDNKQIMKGIGKLSVKLGIGMGQCALLHVGGVFRRAEFFTVGDALLQALACEGDADGGGEIIVSKQIWESVGSHFEGVGLNSGNVRVMELKKGPGHGIPAKADKTGIE